MRFVRWFCADQFLEEIEGDLFELFQEEVADYGLKKARSRFLFKAAGYIKPYFFDRSIVSFHHLYHPIMIKHYFKISFRHILKQRFYSLINIGGLAMGLTCCLLILLYINHELSFDQHYQEGDQIYRVYMEGQEDGKLQGGAVVTTPLAKTLLNEYPEIIQAARIAPDLDEAGTNLVRTEQMDENSYEEGFLYADPSFLEMFQFPMIHGGLDALKRPYTVVLTESNAARFFPGENPVGKSLILNNNTEQPFEVTGVMEDLADNTHLNFDYLLSMEGLEVAQIPNWSFGNFMAYVKLAPGADVSALESKMIDIVKRYKDPDYEENLKTGNYFWYRLQAIKDIHLKSAHIYGYWAHGNIRYVWLFGIIAAFILLIASINFMNLSTARSANRAKEIGLRKVLGSRQKQLRRQFLMESTLISGLAFLLALLLSWLLLPSFNELTGSTLSIPWDNFWLLPLFLAGTLLIGFLSGIYPSFFLSAFKPIQSLKGQLQSGKKGAGFRSALVVFQFTVSIVLIVGSLVVKRQLDYIQNKQLGFNKEQVIIIEDTYTINEQRASFKENLQQISDIEQVSFSSFIPVNGYERNGTGAWPTGTNPDETGINLAKWYVDYDYIKTLGIDVLEGRDFSTERTTDAQEAIIINQKAANLLGYDDPVGKQITSYTFLDTKTGKLLEATYTIIGVVEDFHYESLKQNIQGLSLVLNFYSTSALVKVNTDKPQQLLGDIEKVWAKFAPDQPFRYNFLDERFAKMYAFESRVEQIFTAFTGLAILIACLGLFALATFMAEQRRKEISIRKVLGASIPNIMLLLTKQFTVLVAIALLIATPLAWLLMRSWLQDFAYRISMGWSTFIIAGIAALAIATLTISYQAVRAALANPVDNLRGG